MKLTSSAFTEGASIPSKYTCDGADAIPPLSFESVPENAATLVLIVDDPDAPGGTWDHWIVWNIPRDTKGIREGSEPQGVSGTNSFRKRGWGGPCPPDREHRYFFRLYALDHSIDLPAGSKKREVEAAMRGHILAEAQLMGRYNRPRNR